MPTDTDQSSTGTGIDKYPTESSRRRFVKGVVGSAALASVGTGAAATVGATTAATGSGGGITPYLGINNVDGPAPRGMPLIPLKIDSKGFLQGVWPDEVESDVAVTEIAGHTYRSSWFQYCGVQTYPGIDPAADRDNYFRSTEATTYEWQKQADDLSPGDKLHVDDFSNYEEWGNGIGRSGLGKPAIAAWRSTDVPPQETVVVQVLRSPVIEEMVETGTSDYAEWLRATTADGFIAWLDKCTHFCCVPGFKAYRDSAKFEAANEVYCPCHQSVYDPFDIVKQVFTALPRPEEG